jgi:hypothetical protein
MAETSTEYDSADAQLGEWFSAAAEQQVTEMVLGNRRHGL